MSSVPRSSDAPLSKPEEAALLGQLEMDQETPLVGIRFLIIEDEIVQALLLGEMLSDMGGIVSDTVYGYEQARNEIGRAHV